MAESPSSSSECSSGSAPGPAKRHEALGAGAERFFRQRNCGLQGAGGVPGQRAEVQGLQGFEEDLEIEGEQARKAIYAC